jgi:hypothetical protein
MQAALPAANGDEPIGAQRNAGGHQELDDRVEQRKNPPRWSTWYAGRAADSIAHLVAPSRVARGPPNDPGLACHEDPHDLTLFISESALTIETTQAGRL